jgi:NADPH:quinone reductase-like Zn-dependent oxidoreductase
MKASFRTRYGTSEVLSIRELAKPIPKPNELLVKVHATTVNRSDYHVLTGKPFFMHIFTGLIKPTLSITGSDFVGTVEATGSEVKSYKKGDRVMGFIDMGTKSHATYLTITETNVTHAPTNLPYHQVPAIIEGAFYAICSVHKINPQPNTKALVIGGTGAIGSSYIQFLAYYGATITAVARKEYDVLMRSLGATRIIDYTTEDFTLDTERFDVVIDAVGKYSFTRCKHLLKPKGVFTSSQPNLLEALISPLFGGKKVLFAMPTRVGFNLAFIKKLVESGNFKPVIDRTYSLEKIAEAYDYVATGEKIGNVIITMDD